MGGSRSDLTRAPIAFKGTAGVRTLDLSVLTGRDSIRSAITGGRDA